MRVGILTSWNVPCGVFQYSARLADALTRQPDVEVVILAGRADEGRSVPEESSHEVHDVAGIGLWRDDRRYWLDERQIADLNLDVVHVQYQVNLFTQDALAGLAASFPGVVAVTYHDNCQRRDFPYSAFDLHFSHRWNVGPPSIEVIPFGIEDRRPIVRSFGLGRSRDDLIGPVCARNGWTFESSASYEPIYGGGQSWRTHESLMRWLRGADAIVCWYDDVATAGSSAAVRTALAARRPVFTNDTRWFSEMPDSCNGYMKVRNLAQLEVELAHVLYRPYVWAHSWDRVARTLLDRYAKIGD